MSDAELRQALLGTWRLISFVFDVHCTLVKPLGDNPLGYLVYTPDNHVFAQIATRAERSWPGPEVLELPPPQPMAALGFLAYCGTFEVRDGQLIHHQEFGIWPSLSGRVAARSIKILDSDRLILSASGRDQFEWERVH